MMPLTVYGSTTTQAQTNKKPRNTAIFTQIIYNHQVVGQNPLKLCLRKDTQDCQIVYVILG